MPSSEKDVLNLRPLTGDEGGECGLYLPLEEKKLQPATFPLPTIEDIGDFESARLLRDAARLLLRHGAGPFRSSGHLGFRPRPYQLVPLLMALRISPVRMLIADDVGIGKTIEAALIAREMLDSGMVRRLAVICPPYLCDQWQKELQNKFNLNAVVIRSNTLSRLERELPRQNVSVYEHYQHIIVSVDFVKSTKHMDAFLLHCPDLVIVDEAHGCARPAGASAGQQQRFNLLYNLAKDVNKNLLLVTATPHSGIEESFMSLLGLINPRFEGLHLEVMKEEQRIELAHHFVQRRRVDIVSDAWKMGTETKFPQREPEDVPFVLSSEYSKFFRDIYDFAKELVSEDGQPQQKRRVKYWAALALLRCVMSSPAAAQAALLARIDRLAGSEVEEDIDYSPYVMDTADVEVISDVVPTHVVEQVRSSFTDKEKAKLREFLKRTENLSGKNDGKIEELEKIVRKLIKEGYKPIVFCRYIATADYVRDELKRRLSGDFSGLHVISVTGESSEDEREIKIAELSKSPKRVLVATDCLSEGINLQEHFNSVVHYDLPWNPNRLEQREGRVDRFGQTADIVKAILIYGSDNPIDGAVLEVLLRKARHIHKTLGITVPIPIESDAVMEAVLKALFFKSGETTQLGLFGDDPYIGEFNKTWDRSVEREKRSRSRFAQHAIKPEEVAEEIKKTDAVLGDPKLVESFLRTACQRLGGVLTQQKGLWQVQTDGLPQMVKGKLPNNTTVTFDYPVPEDITYVSRSHDIVSALARYMFDAALQTDGNRSIASRLGVVRSKDVTEVTVLFLLRIRYLVTIVKSDAPSLSEESVVIGSRGFGADLKWLSSEESQELFGKIKPSSNVSPADAKHWGKTVLDGLDKMQERFLKLTEERAQDLLESHMKLRKAIKGGQITVKPIAPIDILTVSVVLPQPQ